MEKKEKRKTEKDDRKYKKGRKEGNNKGGKQKGFTILATVLDEYTEINSSPSEEIIFP